MKLVTISVRLRASAIPKPPVLSTARRFGSRYPKSAARKTSEVYDLKPTSIGFGTFVKSEDGDHPGTVKRAHHSGSGMPGSSLPERIYRTVGNRRWTDRVHA